MHYKIAFLTFSWLCLLHRSLAWCEGPPNTRYINVTVTAAVDRQSVIECWQLCTPLLPSTQSGTAGAVGASLGDLSKASYSIVPANTDGGLHTAPAPQYVVFLAGAAKITVPNAEQEAMVGAGKNGLLFAADTSELSELGHGTFFTEETVLMQVPTANAVVPDHKVLYSGGCRGAELVL